MVRKKTEQKKEEINWSNILPPLSKIPGKTRLGEDQDIKELRRRIRNNPPLPRFLKKEI